MRMIDRCAESDRSCIVSSIESLGDGQNNSHSINGLCCVIIVHTVQLIVRWGGLCFKQGTSGCKG